MNLAALKRKLVEACIIATVTLAMLLGLEMAARAAKQGKNALFPPPVASSPILSQPWGRQYMADEKGLSHRHVDYVEFRERPYRSRTITVDEHGRREVPGNCTRADAFTVWMFGGSTMFGYGVPDDSTIPAYLAKLLNRAGRCAAVVNFGAASWQSSQELLQLVESLKRDRPPQAVVFYDGVNDSSIAEGEEPDGGIEPRVRNLLREAFRGDEGSILGTIARNSVLAVALANRLPGLRRSAGEQTGPAVPGDLEARANGMAAIYLRNLRLAQLLAQGYGVEAYFFLQPYPYISRKKLTPLEAADILAPIPGDEGSLRRLITAFYVAAGREAAVHGPSRYFDISGIFDARTEELFADGDHLLPEGNRIVAERIAREIVLPPAAN